MTNIVCTACNDKYFEACLTLIASIHRNLFKVVNFIYVYNLGLSNKNKDILSKIKDVMIIEFNKLHNDIFNNFNLNIQDYTKNPKMFSWKPICILNTLYYCDMAIYIDSGAVFLENSSKIFDIISEKDILLVEDYHLNYEWTHPQCCKILNAEPSELNDTQIWAGMQGYKSSGKYINFLKKVVYYSQIKECVHGKHAFNYGPGIKGHRHDQSIFSILSSRYSCPRQNLYKFGEYRDLKTAQENNSYIYVHRLRKYNEGGMCGYLEGLCYKS
jgi:hypothetical protein